MKHLNTDLKSILNLNLAEAEQIFTETGLPAYRSKQIFLWIFDKHVVNWKDMSNLPLKLREQLASEWTITTSRVEKAEKGRDGTKKLLIRLFDGQAVESVCIPEEGRNTICLSTQVGCPVGCSFCASGKRGLRRNLSSGEMLEQILHVFSILPAGETIRNIVFMGMGEPMKNYNNVMRAVRAINAPWGFAIGARRITISTVGDIAGIKRLAKERPEVNLAISLHGADDQARSKIIPTTKMPPVTSLVEAAKNYFTQTHRRVTFEYVMIDGINSSVRQAQKLAQILRGFTSFVNLIPLNPVEGVSLKRPNKQCIHTFLRKVELMGIPVAVRAPRGNDIHAACGQLAGKRDK